MSFLTKLQARQEQRSQEQRRPASGPPPRAASNAKESTVTAGSQVPYLGRAGHGGKLQVEHGQVHGSPGTGVPQQWAAHWE